MTTPTRLQLSRKKSFNLQAHSHATNGLPCVNVARPSKWGNPFSLDECRASGYDGTDAQIAARCVSAFQVWLGPNWRENWVGAESEAKRGMIFECLPTLRGKNLACWCALDAPCHADVLLELANAEEAT